MNNIKKSIIILLSLVSMLYAANFSSNDIPKFISSSGTPTVTSIIVISNETGIISDVNLSLNISHTYAADLDITLIHPDGTRIELTTDNGGSGDNYIDTIFDQQASSSITSSSAPFTGTFSPEGNLGALNGKTVNGTWTLEISDDGAQDGGALNSWSLDITAEPIDADGDGMPSSWETANSLDPNDNGSINANNGPDGDPDNDGLPNIEEFQQGHNPQVNDFAKAYEARPEKATIMFIAAHPDDEGIFFGGAIPYYSQVLDVPTICISMTSGDYNGGAPSGDPLPREAEFREALWTYGLRNHPIFPRFRDWYVPDDDINVTWDVWNDNVVGNNDIAAGKLKATEHLATLIRQYRPEVVVSHDLGGEYGHSNHKATGVATKDAFAMAADSNKELSGLPAWSAKKLYLHRYNTSTTPLPVSKLFHDHWETPSINGQTPREVANEGLTKHVSQNSPTVQTVSTAYLTGETSNPVFDPHPSEEWGLHTSLVGADTAVPDFMINGVTYSGFAKSDFLQNISIDSDADSLPDVWESLYSSSSTAMDPAADDDGDGFTNKAEYELGLNPVLPNYSPYSPITISNDGTNLSFTLPEASGPGYTGVDRFYTLQSSADLKIWSPEMSGVANGSLVNYPTSVAANRKFYRLVITVK